MANEEALNALSQKIKDLESKLENLSKTNQLKELDLTKHINVRGGIVTIGAIPTIDGVTPASFTIAELPQIEGSQRASGQVLSMANKDTLDESIKHVIAVSKLGRGRSVNDAGSTQLGIKQTELNNTELIIDHHPNDVRIDNPLDGYNSFYYGLRTPGIAGRTGRVVLGGSTLVDIGLELETNQLVGATLWLYGSTSEAFIISSNTETQITINGTFVNASGEYEYLVIRPVFLGASQFPWRRLYVKDDIRFGIGPTNLGTPTGSTTTFTMRKESDEALSTRAAWGSYLEVQTLGAGFTLTPNTSFVGVFGSAARTSDATTAITDGAFPGQLLLLEGTSDTNTITIKDGANTSLKGDCILGLEDTLLLVFDGDVWVEVARSTGDCDPFEAGDNVIDSDSAVATETGTTLVKKREITVPRAGTLRVKFRIHGSVSGSGHEVEGRIYRNGSAVGTLRSVETTTFTEFEEDISGWAAGDLCQLYARVANGNPETCTVDGFLIAASDCFKGLHVERYVEMVPSSHKVTTTNTWEDWDLSSLIPPDTKQVEISCWASTSEDVGARKNGSSLERRITTNGAVPQPFTFSVNPDSSGIIEIYASANGANSVIFNIWGYWI